MSREIVRRDISGFVVSLLSEGIAPGLRFSTLE
jgi:hypothetical protein